MTLETPATRVRRIQEEVGHAASLFGITSWDRTFLDSVAQAATLSPKQETALARIENKVFGTEGLDETDTDEDDALLEPTDKRWRR